MPADKQYLVWVIIMSLSCAGETGFFSLQTGVLPLLYHRCDRGCCGFLSFVSLSAVSLPHTPECARIHRRTIKVDRASMLMFSMSFFDVSSVSSNGRLCRADSESMKETAFLGLLFPLLVVPVALWNAAASAAFFFFFYFFFCVPSFCSGVRLFFFLVGGGRFLRM